MEPIIKIYASQDYVSDNTVLYSTSQDLTLEQKAQALTNLGVFTQDNEPIYADIGALWVDTSTNMLKHKNTNGAWDIIGSAPIDVDVTLTKVGVAADAKAVGDTISSIETELDATNSTVDSLAAIHNNMSLLTVEDIDNICGRTEITDSDFIDTVTGTSYKLYVENAKLKMEEA